MQEMQFRGRVGGTGDLCELLRGGNGLFVGLARAAEEEGPVA